MDLDGGDPLLVALHTPPARNPHVVELCRLFVLDFFVKRVGAAKAFELLQHEFEHRWYRDCRLPGRLLAGVFALTWLLQSPVYNRLLGPAGARLLRLLGPWGRRPQ